MIEFFQITGSSSFVVHAALEEGGIAYTVHNVHPRRRDTPGFAEANPRRLVPAIRDGDVTIAECGACLLYLVEHHPHADLGPKPGAPGRPDLLRWVMYLANTLHDIHAPLQRPGYFAADPAMHGAVRTEGRRRYERAGAYLESQLADRAWLVADRFSVADIYLYMLKGWESYGEDRLGGDAVDAHFARVGARPAIARTREREDLDERFQRHHPELRGGEPI